MDKKELKKLMTRVAKGELTMDEARESMEKPKKTPLQARKRVKSTTKESNVKFKTNRREVK